MCGITGIYAFNLVGKFHRIHITAATGTLAKRGPDFQDIYLDDWIGLGHRRLAVIDTSDAANQPFWDASGRYCIIFNGEIFNYRALRTELEHKGHTFRTQSDTEVLLQLYIAEKEQALSRLNGFFAFCIYDKEAQSFFLARDRYGIKPLLYVYDEDKFIFGSEMKSIMAYGIDKSIHYPSLYTYLQLNYIPGPQTIFRDVKKLLPGHYLRVGRQTLHEGCYYTLPQSPSTGQSAPIHYDDAKQKLKALLEASVQRRLISDVPLGAFLSGGIDSSVITALASRHTSNLHTFSIGYRDEKFFDETAYARLVSNHFNTTHTVFSLTNQDLLAHVTQILDYLDEPFADSSAIAVYILSKETRKHATVALSGDGADELLGGYNKHAAFYRTLHTGLKEKIASGLGPLWRMLPRSRQHALGNTVRQLARFSEGMSLSVPNRYWRWAGYASESDAMALLSADTRRQLDLQVYDAAKKVLLSNLHEQADMNALLWTDTRMVLPYDMLTKVDLMSMANGLEVRVPFLDHELVNYIASLPADFKITGNLRKRILQDAFRDILPTELYNRPKKGFEVPLLKWFRRELKSLIVDDLLSDEMIQQQGIFDVHEVNKLKQKLFSQNPEDIHARIWGLIVFQHWWKKHQIATPV